MIENKIDFEILNINVTSFSLDIKNEFIQKVKDEPMFNAFTVEVNSAMRGIIDKDIVILELLTRVFLDKEKIIELAKLNVQNIFAVKNLKKYYFKQENILKFPAFFEKTLISICVSHSRALMYSKTQGTLLYKAILPIINPETLLTKKLNNGN